MKPIADKRPCKSQSGHTHRQTHPPAWFTKSKPADLASLSLLVVVYIHTCSSPWRHVNYTQAQWTNYHYLCHSLQSRTRALSFTPNQPPKNKCFRGIFQIDLPSGVHALSVKCRRVPARPSQQRHRNCDCAGQNYFEVNKSLHGVANKYNHTVVVYTILTVHTLTCASAQTQTRTRTYLKGVSTSTITSGINHIVLNIELGSGL